MKLEERSVLGRIALGVSGAALLVLGAFVLASTNAEAALLSVEPIAKQESAAIGKALSAASDDASYEVFWNDLPGHPELGVVGFTSTGEGSELVGNRRSLGVAGGRADNQIDYDADSGTSEVLRVEFARPATDLELKLNRIDSNEWNGLPETGAWVAFDSEGAVVGEGELDPTRTTRARFELTTSAPVSVLEVRATPYGNGEGLTVADNNSDFGILRLEWASAGIETAAPFVPEVTTTTSSLPAATPPTTAPVDAVPETTTSSTPLTFATGTVVAVADGEWSDPETWGGAVPGNGAEVIIPAARTVTLDGSTSALQWIHLHGLLEVASDSPDSAIDTGGIMVHEGELRIGYEDSPHKGRVSITLHDRIENDHCGRKFICVMDGGSLELHGESASKVSWVQLDGSVDAGATSITVDRAVDWEAGDTIVIAPSGFDGLAADEVEVTAVSGRTVSFAPPLQFPHFGEVQLVDGREVDMRAEVGLLSRNIVIQGDASSQYGPADYPVGVGGHIMAHANTTVHVEGVELFRMGQTRGAGRYPLHFHLGGDGSGQYVRNNSVHHSFHRGIVTHGVNNVVVADNVAFDVFSHIFVMSEDGTEWGNRYERNLAVSMRRFAVEDFAFPAPGHTSSSQEERRPGMFWGNNFQNPLIGNHAAGSYRGNGFLFNSTRISRRNFDDMDMPVQVGEFRDNVAHSHANPGHTNPFYGPRTTGHGLMVRGASRFGSIDEQVVFEDFTAYKIGVGGMWIESEYHQVDGCAMASVATAVIVMASGVNDCHASQTSTNQIGGVLGDTVELHTGGSAFMGCVHLFRSTPYVGNTPHISNMTCASFVNGAIVMNQRLQNDATVEQMTLINNGPARWSGAERHSPIGSVTDLDGSLLGQPGAVLTPFAAGGATYIEEYASYLRSS